MSFWETVLAFVLASAIYDFLHMIIRPEGDDGDDLYA